MKEVQNWWAGVFGYAEYIGEVVGGPSSPSSRSPASPASSSSQKIHRGKLRGLEIGEQEVSVTLSTIVRFLVPQVLVSGFLSSSSLY